MTSVTNFDDGSEIDLRLYLASKYVFFFLEEMKHFSAPSPLLFIKVTLLLTTCPGL